MNILVQCDPLFCRKLDHFSYLCVNQQTYFNRSQNLIALKRLIRNQFGDVLKYTMLCQ